jgi:uncharacterized protein
VTADPANIIGLGFAFPPRIRSDGRIAFSVGEENVRESIKIILMTELRERIRRPTFGGGLGQFLFEPNNLTTRHAIQDRITKSLGAWERRIMVQSVEVECDPGDAEAAIATVVYKLVATQAPGRVSLNIALSS